MADEWIENAHVEILVPVRVESFLDDTGGMGLLCVDCDDCKWIWETEDVSFGEPVRSDD